MSVSEADLPPPCVEWHLHSDVYLPYSNYELQLLPDRETQDRYVAGLFLLQGSKIILDGSDRVGQAEYRVARPKFIGVKDGHDFCIPCNTSANHGHLMSAKHLRRVQDGIPEHRRFKMQRPLRDWPYPPRTWIPRPRGFQARMERNDLMFQPPAPVTQ